MLAKRLTTLAGVFLAALAAGCGSSGSPGTSGASTSTSGAPAGGSGSSAQALAADAASASTGDIPDNQVFLVLHDGAAGYSMKYPEGWTRSGSNSAVTLQDKNNLVRVVVRPGPVPTTASVTAALQALKAKDPTLTFTPARIVHAGSNEAVKTTYTTQSAPNPVTGKRVVLIVDRYELARGGRRAVVELGTPRGVDNVDAYRKMIESFRWQ
jgi:hypothetical protein